MVVRGAKVAPLEQSVHNKLKSVLAPMFFSLLVCAGAEVCESAAHQRTTRPPAPAVRWRFVTPQDVRLSRWPTARRLVCV